MASGSWTDRSRMSSCRLSGFAEASEQVESGIPWGSLTLDSWLKIVVALRH
jgi:hypothetical protein